MDNNSVFNHLKNILLLPVNVTIVIPFLLHRSKFNSKITNDHVIFTVLGCILILIGVTLLLYTIFLFRTKGKGTLAPWNPTRKLVISGPYRYMRNPMITGVLTILAGEALYFNSIAILIWGMLFFMISTVYFQFMEEPKLERRFGNDYTDYKDNVPRWIPKRKPYFME
jgi:protein-S-isoprenylcysteine O-methyltransferase Ste14